MAASHPHSESNARPDQAQTAWTIPSLLISAGVIATADVSDALVNTSIDRLTVDSRDAGVGACFVAIAGTQTDGHRYVSQALDQGASAVIVEKGRCKVCDERIIEVADTHEAIAKLAATFFGIDRLQREGKLGLIGVTGTNGKTTVVSLITSILRAAGVKASSLGTIGLDVPGGVTGASTTVISGMTTPPPIELCAALASAARAGARCVAMEVSSHALDQRRTAGLRFDVAVFTNLTQDHLDYHGDMDGYAAAKRRLFDGLDIDATAVANADDARSLFMITNCTEPTIAFSLDNVFADVRSENLQMGASGSTFDLHIKEECVAVKSRLIGKHNVSNMLAAISAAYAWGVDCSAIAKGVASIECVPGRLERVACESPGAVFVDYAHTPDALENVLRVVRDVTRGRLICVFGCGGDRDKSKRAPMGRAVAAIADVGILTSDNPRHEDPQAIINDVLVGFEGSGKCQRIVQIDRRAAIYKAIALAGEDDTVLIAGKGHEDYQIIGDKRFQFDDRQVAIEAALQTTVEAVQKIEVPA
ncbi:MAG TPA: UDP-N-acetylmuramoyl-L-alanyl-D-glutamate--2,6-diaminopimelate ligase [Phycisphaerae bacterium]|nr:UDP-N-acetylmuramoyl-L-alanyl-D-glutamate--2,6-diaminopimelate ligase [Phycisphaerae bacterium]